MSKFVIFKISEHIRNIFTERELKENSVVRDFRINEEVRIYYHGKLKGILTPFKQSTNRKVENHPFFGMYKEDKDSVEDVMNQLRGERYHVYSSNGNGK